MRSVKKSRIVILVVFALLCGLLLIRILLPNKVYRYEGSASFTEEAAEEKIVYEGIALPAGVYCVELEFAADTDRSAMCTLRDGTVIHGGLLTNGEHLYAANDRTGYQMWLFEDTEQLQVMVSYDGGGHLTTGDLTIRETDQLWSMLLVTLLAVGGLILAGMRFRTCEKKQIVFCIVLIGLIASIPSMYGAILSGGDTTYHLLRIEGCKDSILSGQFPVRIEPKWLYGHGYASAIFYCNALLYFPALLRLAGFTITASYNVFCIALNLATAWVAWYCFKKIFNDDHIGVVCSALYTLSLYRIYTLYYPTRVGEASAYLFLPLVLYGLYRAFTQDPKEQDYRTVWLPIALGYAGLLQTHVLTCEITAFVTILICLIGIRKVFCPDTFRELAKGVLGAVGLSVWFLVPFLDYYITQDVHVKHVSGRTIQERGLFFADLLTGNPSPELGEVVIGPLLSLGFCAFLILGIRGWRKGRRDPVWKLAVLSAAFGLLLAVMSLRAFPWDRIQSLGKLSASLVSSLQFPIRLLNWATLFLVILAGYVLRELKEGGKALYRAGLIVFFAGTFLLAIYRMDLAMTQRNVFRLYNVEGMGFGYISGAEYLIEGTDESLLTFEGPHPGEGVELEAYRKNYLQIDLRCSNSNAGEGYIDLPLLLYKGYRARDRVTGRMLTVCDGANHAVRVVLPEGFSGEVQVRFISPFYWRIAEVLSLLTAAGLIASRLRREKGEI